MGQPEAKSPSGPVKLHLGQRTDAKKRPQWGQVFVSRSTSAPQLLQKKRGFFTGI
jgi:hypothetical protein